MSSVNKAELRKKVKQVYKKVAEAPHGEFHFEMGRRLAERLGYSADDLDKIPPEAIESFAGVGHHFDLAGIEGGESVLDLGSGSGTDVFIAALKVGQNGKVIGIDMTDEQLEKAKKLGAHFQNVFFRKGYIEALPFEDESFDVVISNGVINLSAEKEKVFQEVSRVLKRGGRMAISDIVSEQELPENVSCNASLWASCIGGAIQEDYYKAAIERAGLQIDTIRENRQYQFLSDSARGASKEWGVKSISLVAVKKR